MNRISTLTAVIGLSAAALLAQPFAAQAAGIRPVGGMRQMPGMIPASSPVLTPLSGHGIVVNPIVGPPTLIPVDHAPVITPVKKDPVITPVQRNPVITPVQHDPVITPVKHDPIITPVKRDPVITPVKREPVITPIKRKPVITPIAHFPIDPPPRRARLVGTAPKPVPFPIRGSAKP